MHQNRLAYLTIKALIHDFYDSLLLVSWQINEWRRTFFWMKCCLQANQPEYYTRILKLFSKPNYYTFSKKLVVSDFFSFTLWYCLKNCYMNVLFLFEIRSMKISETYECKLSKLHALGQHFKNVISFFFSFISVFPGELNNIYREFNKMKKNWTESEEKKLRMGGEETCFIMPCPNPPKENLKKCVSFTSS